MKRSRDEGLVVTTRLSAFFALLALGAFVAGVIGIINVKAGPVVIGFVLFVFFGACGWWLSPQRIRRRGDQSRHFK